MVRDAVLIMRLPSEVKQRWVESANRQGIGLTGYVERCVEEAQALEHALERQVEDERRRRLVLERG